MSKFDRRCLTASARPSQWEMKAPDLRTIPGSSDLKPLARKMFEDKFKQYNFDWQKMPQEQEKEANE